MAENALILAKHPLLRNFSFCKNPITAAFSGKKTEPQFCIKITVLIWWSRCVSIRTFSISTSGVPEKPLAFWGEGRAREWTDVFAIRQKQSQTHFALTWWAFRDSNPGPTGYEPVALTN